MALLLFDAASAKRVCIRVRNTAGSSWQLARLALHPFTPHTPPIAQPVVRPLKQMLRLQSMMPVASEYGTSAPDRPVPQRRHCIHMALHKVCLHVGCFLQMCWASMKSTSHSFLGRLLTLEPIVAAAKASARQCAFTQGLNHRVYVNWKFTTWRSPIGDRQSGERRLLFSAFGNSLELACT